MQIKLTDALALNRKISRIIAIADRDRRLQIKSVKIRWWERVFTTRESIAYEKGNLSYFDDIINKAYQWTHIYTTLASGARDKVRISAAEYGVYVTLHEYALYKEILK